MKKYYFAALVLCLCLCLLLLSKDRIVWYFDMKNTVGINLPVWDYKVIKEYNFSSSSNDSDVHYGLELEADIYSNDIHKILQSEHQTSFSSLGEKFFIPFFNEEIDASDGGLLGGCAGGDNLGCGVLFFNNDNKTIYFEYIKSLSISPQHQ
jgi:hypothetical protein